MKTFCLQGFLYESFPLPRDAGELVLSMLTSLAGLPEVEIINPPDRILDNP